MSRLALIILSGFLALQSCATYQVRFSVRRPAQVNLQGRKQIALGTFKGKNSGHVSLWVNTLSQQLLETAYFDAVMDRQYIQDILVEHRLQLSGLVDDKTIVELGSFIGAAILVYGSIDDDRYQEKLSEVVQVLTNRHRTKLEDEKGFTLYTNSVTTNRFFQRRGEYRLVLSFQLVDVESGRLLTVSTLDRTGVMVKTSRTGSPELIDQEALFLDTLRTLNREFVSGLVPSMGQVRVHFQKDRKLAGLDRAVALLQAGDMEGGLELLNAMAANRNLPLTVQAKALYNLGIAQGFSRQFDEARENIIQARRLNPKQKLYTQALYLIEEEQKNAELLLQQE